MPIFKIHHQTRFASIPNATLRDKRLSIESRGVLAYLLTHDSKFELSFVFLQKELGIGRDKLKNIVRELKQSGYLCLVAAHNKNGSFDGQEWFVFAESQNADFTIQTFDRLTEKPSDVKTVRRENRQTENPSDNKEENSSQKKIFKEENFKEEEKKERENALALAASPDLPVSDNFENYAFLTNFDLFEIHAHFFKSAYGLSVKDKQIIKNRIIDKRAWIEALVFWHENNYLAKSVGKQCDKYDEILIEGVKKQNAKNQPNKPSYTDQRESDARKRLEFSSVADEILRREGIIPAGSS